MAQKVKVSVICDLSHPSETEGTQTIQFSFDGRPYEFDACTKHAAEFSKVMTSFADNARRGGRAAARTPRRRGSSEQIKAIRAWANERGLAVNERGRIPRDVIDMFECRKDLPASQPKPPADTTADTTGAIKGSSADSPKEDAVAAPKGSSTGRGRGASSRASNGAAATTTAKRPSTRKATAKEPSAV